MTELEKLKNAENLIRDMTEGRLEMHAAMGNHVYIRPRDDAYVGLDMIIRGDFEKKCYPLCWNRYRGKWRKAKAISGPTLSPCAGRMRRG